MSAGFVPADLQQHPAPRRITRRALAGAAAAGATLLWGGAPARAAARWWSSLVFGVLENRAYSTVETLPSHVRLAREGAVLSNYDAIGHPSGPNYRAMISGEAWGTGEIVDTFHPSVASAAAALVPPVPTYVYHLAGTIAARHNPFVDLHAPAGRPAPRLRRVPSGPCRRPAARRAGVRGLGRRQRPAQRQLLPRGPQRHEPARRARGVALVYDPGRLRPVPRAVSHLRRKRRPARATACSPRGGDAV